jgi:peptide/nickel transport system substrate-binding protein
VGDPSDSGIFEKAFQQKVGSKMGQPGTLIMGTGPWEFKSLNPSAGAQLVANPHYWGPTKPTFKRISFTFFSSESSMALAFRAGQIDIAPEISEPRAFTSTSGSQLRAIPQCEVEAFYMPTNVPQWANIHVRRAVAYALNAEDIVKAKGVPAQIISSMILPSQLALLGSSSQAQQLVSSAPSYKYDLTKAKQEMAESPYPHGFSATFPTNTPYFGTDPQVVASQLQSIGIRMNVIDEPASKWIADAQAGKYAGLTWANCPTYDPSSLILNYFGPDNPVNLSHYNPPEFDRLLDLSTAQYSPSQRLATYGKIMNMLGSQVPMIALFSADYTAAIGPKVSWPTATGNYVERPWALGVTAKG